MRTTVYLPDDLLIQAKRLAASRRTTLTKLIEDSLRQSLGRKQAKPAPRAYRVVTYKGNGTWPGVDLDNTAALVDLLDDSAVTR